MQPIHYKNHENEVTNSNEKISYQIFFSGLVYLTIITPPYTVQNAVKNIWMSEIHCNNVSIMEWHISACIFSPYNCI